MAGENMFRRLSHTGVVRHFERIATVAHDAVDAVVPITRRVRIDDTWSRSRLRVVVFLQDMATSAITGAATVLID